MFPPGEEFTNGPWGGGKAVPGQRGHTSAKGARGRWGGRVSEQQQIFYSL